MSNSEEEKVTGEEPRSEKAEEILKRTETRVRHIGYVVLFGTAIFIFFPILFGAIQGVQEGRVWDPFTGSVVSPTERAIDCREEAGDLIFLAGSIGELESRWEQRHRRWVLRCQDSHPDLYDLLVNTRDRLRGAVESPEIDDPGVD